ncbi:MAG: hypothetical protein PHT07_09415 [Paludibacter sp.]|nr:hypothetical protein [Paludibacter sp.]
MKKIYFIVSFAVLALFTACNDYNATNFPDIKSVPTNVVQYNYTLTDADYGTIATAIKKPVNDSISLLKAQLKTASKADSVTINTSLTRLNTKLTTDSVYIKASYIASNKFFTPWLKAKDYIPYLLNSAYQFTDNGSTFKATYNSVNIGDTTAILPANRFTIADADYIQMGIPLKDFSSTSNVMQYLNTYLRLKAPYAAANDVKVVSYLYYDTNKVAKKQYRILKFDGTVWAAIPDQYINNGQMWLYDPTLYVPLVKGAPNNLYVMAFLNYLLLHKDDAVNPTPWFPKLAYVNEEHYYGFSAYYPEIICTADRTTYGDAAIKALTTNDAKYALFAQRVKEAMPLFTQVNFPLLQSTVSGLQQYVVFTIPSYYSSSKAGLYTIKMKCTVSGTTTSPAVFVVESIVETF